MQYPGVTTPFGSGLSVGSNVLANGLNSPQSLEARKAALVRQMVLGNGQRTAHPAIGASGGSLHGSGGLNLPAFAAGNVGGADNAAVAANGGGMFYGQGGTPTPAAISTGAASAPASPAAAPSQVTAQQQGITGLFLGQNGQGISGGYNPLGQLDPAIIAQILANHTRG